jgi:ubiquinol oxidase
MDNAVLRRQPVYASAQTRSPGHAHTLPSDRTMTRSRFRQACADFFGFPITTLKVDATLTALSSDSSDGSPVEARVEPADKPLATEHGTAASDAEPPVHHAPKGFSDRFALGFTKLLRFGADTLFAKRYGHRAIVLETVAAVPGMVGATATHLKCLRRMVDDDGWIRTLMEEAENERMHLMTFVAIAKPTGFERLVILLAQWVFYVGFFLLYLVSSRTAHRVVGYFEEEAVLSYTLYLKEIDAGRVPNVAAPAIARQYWQLPADATLRDVVLVVRADEAHHRDVNHRLASTLAGEPVAQAKAAPYPQHADRTRLNA